MATLRFTGGQFRWCWLLLATYRFARSYLTGNLLDDISQCYSTLHLQAERPTKTNRIEMEKDF